MIDYSGFYVNKDAVTIEVRRQMTWSDRYQCRVIRSSSEWYSLNAWDIATFMANGVWRPHALSVAPGL